MVEAPPIPASPAFRLDVPSGMASPRRELAGHRAIVVIDEGRAHLAAAAWSALATVASALDPAVRGSDLARIGLEGRRQRLSADAGRAVRRALAWAAATDGAYDPTRRPAGDPAGRWRDVVLELEPPALRLPPGVRFDLGGLFAAVVVEHALVALAEAGAGSVLVAVDGTVAAGGRPVRGGWRITLEPTGPAVRLRSGALAIVDGAAGGLGQAGLVHARGPLAAAARAAARRAAPPGPQVRSQARVVPLPGARRDRA